MAGSNRPAANKPVVLSEEAEKLHQLMDTLHSSMPEGWTFKNGTNITYTDETCPFQIFSKQVEKNMLEAVAKQNAGTMPINPHALGSQTLEEYSKGIAKNLANALKDIHDAPLNLDLKSIHELSDKKQNFMESHTWGASKDKLEKFKQNYSNVITGMDFSSAASTQWFTAQEKLHDALPTPVPSSAKKLFTIVELSGIEKSKAQEELQKLYAFRDAAEKLEKIDAKHDDLIDQARKLEEEIKEIKPEDPQSVEKKKDLQDQIEKLDKEREDLSAEIIKLEADKTNKENELRNLSIDPAKLKANIQSVASRLQGIQQEQYTSQKILQSQLEEMVNAELKTISSQIAGATKEGKNFTDLTKRQNELSTALENAKQAFSANEQALQKKNVLTEEMNKQFNNMESEYAKQIKWTEERISKNKMALKSVELRNPWSRAGMDDKLGREYKTPGNDFSNMSSGQENIPLGSYQTTKFAPGFVYRTKDAKYDIAYKEERGKDGTVSYTIGSVAPGMALCKEKNYKAAKNDQLNFKLAGGDNVISMVDNRNAFSPYLHVDMNKLADYHQWTLETVLNRQHDFFVLEKNMPMPTDQKELNKMKNSYVISMDKGSKIKGTLYSMHYVDEKGESQKLGLTSKEIKLMIPRKHEKYIAGKALYRGSDLHTTDPITKFEVGGKMPKRLVFNEKQLDRMQKVMEGKGHPLKTKGVFQMDVQVEQMLQSQYASHHLTEKHLKQLLGLVSKIKAAEMTAEEKKQLRTGTTPAASTPTTPISTLAPSAATPPAPTSTLIASDNKTPTPVVDPVVSKKNPPTITAVAANSVSGDILEHKYDNDHDHDPVDTNDPLKIDDINVEMKKGAIISAEKSEEPNNSGGEEDASFGVENNNDKDEDKDEDEDEEDATFRPG